mmetsp:Transcript_58120/g.131700  ORF Transcript_58120/g.131700 Transcript_58120/m.131700 type:complete len:122 (+) Transcript_58120:71-436(+)
MPYLKPAIGGAKPCSALPSNIAKRFKKARIKKKEEDEYWAEVERKRQTIKKRKSGSGVLSDSDGTRPISTGRKINNPEKALTLEVPGLNAPGALFVQNRRLYPSPRPRFKVNLSLDNHGVV